MPASVDGLWTDALCLDGLEVGEVFFEAVEDRKSRVILIDIGVADALLVSLREDGWPVESAFAEFGDVFSGGPHDEAGGGVGDAVFEVKKLDAVSVAGKHGDGVLTCLGEPVHIELELHEGGVGVLHEHVEAGCVPLRRPLVAVVVKGELHACVVDAVRPGVEVVGSFVEAFEVPLIFGQTMYLRPSWCAYPILVGTLA
jgi:hypothetical protein